MPNGLERYSHCKFTGTTDPAARKMPASIKMPAINRVFSRCFFDRLLGFIGRFWILQEVPAGTLFIRHGFLADIEPVKPDFANGESGKLSGQFGNHCPATGSKRAIT